MGGPTGGENREKNRKLSLGDVDAAKCFRFMAKKCCFFSILISGANIYIYISIFSVFFYEKRKKNVFLNR